ncbi:hypothetical protein H5410_007268 [Solanum commersonii]|uniref:Uncharacterized protein n=1 Tax=Solanum commersonii TaxID=4109 RepID=A0A9J6AD02_SOLCO|nr:hypothetical protein H5410_007268 [Solanum commersonii]
MPKSKVVLRRVIYASEINPPKIVSKKAVPKKFVVLVAAPAKSKCITDAKYTTKLIIFATKPILSNNIIPAKSHQIKYVIVENIF